LPGIGAGEGTDHALEYLRGSAHAGAHTADERHHRGARNERSAGAPVLWANDQEIEWLEQQPRQPHFPGRPQRAQTVANKSQKPVGIAAIRKALDQLQHLKHLVIASLGKAAPNGAGISRQINRPS
jgi:hypothetical protein